MDNINEFLKSWLKRMDEYSYPSYSNLPDLDLYMDQVTTYLDKQLNIFTISSLDKQITSSMINNYVKGKVVDVPSGKKYTKQHIAKILEIYALKRIFSISEIKQILDSQHFKSNEEPYNFFIDETKKSFHEAITSTEDKLKDIKKNDTYELKKLALELGLKAQANAILASRILSYVKIQENLNTPEKTKEKNIKNND